MKINKIIYKMFRDLVIDSLNSTLRETKESITKNSFYRYGTLEDKLDVIEELKHDHGTHFNFFRVKGVEYQQGEFKLNENEFNELIVEYKLNLEDSNFGLFQNENDQGKVLADKSFIQVTSILDLCLKLQILNEAKQQLFTPQLLTDNFTPNLTIFKNRESHLFFNFLFDDWLKDIEDCRPELSYIVWAMRNEKKENDLNTENTINDFSITCPSLGEFAKFWNSYSHSFKLTFIKSKLNLNDPIGNKHKSSFDNRKEEFINRIM